MLRNTLLWLIHVLTSECVVSDLRCQRKDAGDRLVAGVLTGEAKLFLDVVANMKADDIQPHGLLLSGSGGLGQLISDRAQGSCSVSYIFA